MHAFQSVEHNFRMFIILKSWPYYYIISDVVPCIFLLITDREELRRSASWTLSGIVLPEDRSRGRTKPSLSKRMQSLVDSQKRRILVFRNGESSEGVEIVAGRFDEV